MIIASSIVALAANSWPLSFCNLSGAMIDKTSSASVTKYAPCFNKVLQPADSGLVMFPGTTNKSLP